MMNSTQFFLTKYIEENGEGTHEACKAQQFGLDMQQVSGQETNGEKLRREILDQLVMIELLQELGMIEDITRLDISRHSVVKRDKLRKYLEKSKELGFVSVEVIVPEYNVYLEKRDLITIKGEERKD